MFLLHAPSVLGSIDERMGRVLSNSHWPQDIRSGPVYGLGTILMTRFVLRGMKARRNISRPFLWNQVARRSNYCLKPPSRISDKTQLERIERYNAAGQVRRVPLKLSETLRGAVACVRLVKCDSLTSRDLFFITLRTHPV